MTDGKCPETLLCHLLLHLLHTSTGVTSHYLLSKVVWFVPLISVRSHTIVGQTGDLDYLSRLLSYPMGQCKLKSAHILKPKSSTFLNITTPNML